MITRSNNISPKTFVTGARVNVHVRVLEFRRDFAGEFNNRRTHYTRKFDSLYTAKHGRGFSLLSFNETC